MATEQCSEWKHDHLCIYSLTWDRQIVSRFLVIAEKCK